MAGVEKQWTGGRSVLTVRELGPTVFYLRMSGFHDDLNLTKQFATWFDRRTAGVGRVHMFWDTTETIGYKSECRVALEQWQKQAVPRLASVTVLVKSRLMEMAISVTNLLVGGVNKATRDRAKFDAMIKSAIEREGYGSRDSAAAPPA
jgi:hypothetical protein